MLPHKIPELLSPIINSLTQRMGDALIALRPATTTHKNCFVKATTNGWMAIRNTLLTSLVRFWPVPCRPPGAKNM